MKNERLTQILLSLVAVLLLVNIVIQLKNPSQATAQARRQYIGVQDMSTSLPTVNKMAQSGWRLVASGASGEFVMEK